MLNMDTVTPAARLLNQLDEGTFEMVRADVLAECKQLGWVRRVSSDFRGLVLTPLGSAVLEDFRSTGSDETVLVKLSAGCSLL